MTATKFCSIWSILFFFCLTYHLTRCENIYIVASSKSFCISEYRGEPCLTLQQFLASLEYYTDNNNISLIMESGIHELPRSRSSSSYYVTSINILSMISDSEDVTIQMSSVYYVSIRGVQNIHLRGITFKGSGALRFENAHEVLIEDCKFLGVAINLFYITTANVSRTHFSKYCDLTSSMLRSYSTSFLMLNYCTFTNGGGVDITGRTYALLIFRSNFSNNQGSNGAALYINTYYPISQCDVVVSECIFSNNKANGYGGAIYYYSRYNRNRYSLTINISESIFINNSASDCGAISAKDERQSQLDINITASMFYYNKALSYVSGHGNGGVACINDISVTISNCTFVQNVANHSGGVFRAENSTLNISNSYFYRNSAREDGGVLFTFTYSTTFFIALSAFFDNAAGDDGGAIMISRRGSLLSITNCAFRNNHASDRGGAIAIYGSTISTVATIMHSNQARFGNSIGACYTTVTTPISPGITDHNFTFCTNFDSDSAHNSIPEEFQELSNPNNIDTTTLLLNTARNRPSCIQSSVYSYYDNILKKLQRAYTVAITALTIAITTAIGLLLCIVIKLLIKYQLKWKRNRQTTFATSNKRDNTNEIAMTPNVVYERSGLNP